MRLEKFTTDSYPVHQRPHAWREALQLHSLRPEMAPAAAPLYGTLTARRTARGVEMARITSSPQTIQRLGAGADAVWLALHMGGDAALHHGQQTIELAPGDIVFGPAHAQADLDFRSNFRQFMVSMPGASLKTRLPGDHAFALGHLRGSAGLGRMFAGTLTALADAFDTLDDDDIAPVESALSEFIATSMAARRDLALPASSAISSTRAATVRRLCQYVDANLSDPSLTVAGVAAHEHLSERLVQKLFEGLGQTFTAYLRQSRLERCRADLANRQYGHLSISDICFRWGFNDPAHFSHSFRDRYGMSPRQYRQQANEVSQQSLRKRIKRGWPSGYFETPAADPVASSAGIDTVAARRAVDSSCVDGTSTNAISTVISTGIGAGRHHHLPANAQTIHWGYFSRSIPPVLRIESGDIVTIETLTQHAYDDHERMIKGDSGAESVFHWTAEHKAVDRRGAGPTDASIYGRGSGEGFGVHICTGPIFVKDAQPGDVLEVRILDLAPRLAASARYEGRAFGSNAAAWWGFHYDDLIEEPKQREVVTIYEVDCSQDQPCAHAVYNFRWTPQRDPNGVLHPTIDYPGIPIDRASIVENHGVLQGVTIPVRPHFGVIAVAPAETGLVDSIPPSCFGGNLDNWRIAKGATLYLRVGVDGALLSVGDPHASQGDSELCGTAIECSLTGVFQIVLHKAANLRDEPFADIDYPLVETADEWVIHGFSHPDYLKEFGDKARSAIYEKSSLDPAMRDAFRKTRRFLMTAMGLTEDEAISLMSVAVDFGVTQVVDGNWGVHAVIRKSMFAGRVRAQAAPSVNSPLSSP
ncbi:acetamidase/formamidase family protein [Variovorax sp. LG9.2]|uniref:acetamidase/formamidase family protein n=1 Tax=Variovorax sp. LG9.2 TaxID=3048626 RepID=UPI002B238EA1|nr:acetamidase/formamidase family protein [Variovorax sp. LG9.2]MEB0055931.1 acetamidase/formamidase family protein [Variovorax sp. LG9.2]